MPQQRKEEESERLRRERDQIKFIDLGFERWQVAAIDDIRIICFLDELEKLMKFLE